LLRITDYYPHLDSPDIRNYENHRTFFLLAALLFPIDALDTHLEGWENFLDQGFDYAFS